MPASWSPWPRSEVANEREIEDAVSRCQAISLADCDDPDLPRLVQLVGEVLKDGDVAPRRRDGVEEILRRIYLAHSEGRTRAAQALPEMVRLKPPGRKAADGVSAEVMFRIRPGDTFISIGALTAPLLAAGADVVLVFAREVDVDAFFEGSPAREAACS